MQNMTRTNPAFRLLATVLLGMLLVGCRSPEVRKARYKEAGDRYVAQQKYKEASLEYRNALKIDARDGEARWKLAGAMDAAGKTPDAYREYIRAAELLPKRSDVQEKAAAIYLGAREFATARKHAEAALAIDPRSTTAQLLLANALAGLKDLPSALREIEEAIEMAPLDSRPYTNLGGLRLAEGKRQEAEAAFRKAIELDPKSLMARVALGYFYWSTGALDKAEQQLTQAVAIDEKNPLANRILVLFYLTNKRPGDAEAPLLRLAAANDAAATMTVADFYARTGRGKEARPLYERLLLKDKALRTNVIGRLAHLDYAEGGREAAYKRLDEELAKQPNQVQLLTIKADFLLRERRTAEAEQIANKAVANGADSAQARYTLGLAQAAQRKTDEATKSFNEVLRLNPRAANAEVQLANLSLVAGKPDDALRHAVAARKVEPSNVQARLGMATALLAKRDLSAAEAEITALMTEFPTAAAVHALAGNLAAARSDFAGATSAFDRALGLDPANLPALAGRVAIDLRLKRVAEGRARLSGALAAQPKSPQLRMLAARFENSAGDFAAAERHLRSALELDPATLEGYAILGRMYLRQRKLDEARREFEQLAKRTPNPVASKTMVAVIYDLQNRPIEATKIYEEIVGATSRAAVASNNLAWRYAENGEKLDFALQLAQSAKAQLPEQPEVDDTLGWVYYKKNMPQLAIPPLENSVKRDPANGMYHLHLGLAYAKAGRKQDAIRALEQALKLKSDLPGADEARTTLAALKG